MQTIDPHLDAEYKRLAVEGNNFQGLSIATYSRVIRSLVDKTGAKTLLDYGSGRGAAYDEPLELHREWGVVKPVLYDPSFPSHSYKPPAGSKFDGVLCSDVLEHIPSNLVLNVVEELFSYSRKFVWASVCCRPAKKVFPDGTNMHVTLWAFHQWDTVFKQTAMRHRKIRWRLDETV